MTPELYSVKLKDNPNYTLISRDSRYLFEIIWECPVVANFWKMVQSSLMSIPVPLSPSVFILNHLSHLKLQKSLKCVFLAGMTAKAGWNQVETSSNITSATVAVYFHRCCSSGTLYSMHPWGK